MRKKNKPYLSTSRSADHLARYNPDEALQEFHVPASVFEEWEEQGVALSKRDILDGTNIKVEEIRVIAPFSEELKKVSC